MSAAQTETASDQKWSCSQTASSIRRYLSDVAFGAALGIVAGRTVTIGRGNARFALAPLAAPDGGGVSLTWIDPR